MNQSLVGIKEDFRLGSCIVKPSARIIEVDGQSHQLQPRIMNLLCYLVERKEDVVTYDELMEHVWEGTIVSDVAIHRGISILRQCLQDNPKKPEYIKTVDPVNNSVYPPSQM